jgi:hypothetical protein
MSNLRKSSLPIALSALAAIEAVLLLDADVTPGIDSIY